MLTNVLTLHLKPIKSFILRKKQRQESFVCTRYTKENLTNLNLF